MLPIGDTCGDEGRVITSLPLTTVGAPTVVAGCRVRGARSWEARTVCVAGPGDFKVIREGSAVTGAAAPVACTTCAAAAAARTAEMRIIVHLVRMPQF